MPASGRSGLLESDQAVDVGPDAEDLAREDADSRRRDRAVLIDAVLDELSAVGSLSDERFVSNFVDGRIRRGKGPMLIRAELRERGGDESLIDRFLTFSDAFWIDKVRGVRERRFGTAVPADAGERNRQARFLASRGFPSDLIRRAFERG